MKSLAVIAFAFFSASAMAQAASQEFNCRDEAGHTVAFVLSHKHRFISFSDLSGFGENGITGQILPNNPMEITESQPKSISFEYPWYFTSRGTITFEKEWSWIGTGDLSDISITFDDGDGYGFENKVFGCVRAD